jgi:hypothetical protein
MTTIITWSIEQLNRELSDGLVTTAHWCCTAEDDDFFVNTCGSVGFERGNTFIEYDKLTQEEVINWVKAKLDVVEIENGLQSHIESVKNPVSAVGVPW